MFRVPAERHSRGSHKAADLGGDDGSSIGINAIVEDDVARRYAGMSDLPCRQTQCLRPNIFSMIEKEVPVPEGVRGLEDCCDVAVEQCAAGSSLKTTRKSQ